MFGSVVMPNDTHEVTGKHGTPAGGNSRQGGLKTTIPRARFWVIVLEGGDLFPGGGAQAYYGRLDTHAYVVVLPWPCLPIYWCRLMYGLFRRATLELSGWRRALQPVQVLDVPTYKNQPIC